MQAILSIVIANYNYGRFIESAIRSTVQQADQIVDHRLIIEGQQVELIVCDAASTDNSVEIIEKYSDSIFWWCSEKDAGQSAAFNKGFDHGTGRYLTWLNADDIYLPGALHKVIRQIVRHPDCDWFTGNSLDFLNDGTIITCAIGPHWYPDFLQCKNSPVVCPGPTSFFSREIYLKAGKIDESQHYTMDSFLWIKFMLGGVKQRRINSIVWAFRHHADSKTAEFEGHQMSLERRKRANAEFRNAMIRDGLHYHYSKFVYMICLVLRLLDFSLLRRWCYRHLPKFGKIPSEFCNQLAC